MHKNNGVLIYPYYTIYQYQSRKQISFIRLFGRTFPAWTTPFPKPSSHAGSYFLSECLISFCRNEWKISNEWMNWANKWAELIFVLFWCFSYFVYLYFTREKKELNMPIANLSALCHHQNHCKFFFVSK